MNATFELYKDSAGEYRWRLRAPNNRIIADSGEGYSTKEAAKQSIDRFRQYVQSATVKDLT